MPGDPAEAVDLARTIPAPCEVFPVPYRTAQAVLAGLLKQVGDASPDAEPAPPAAVRIRGEEITPLAGRPRPDGTLSAAVRPGDLVMVDAAAEIFTPRPPDGSFSPQVVVAAAAEDPDSPGMASRSPARDVLHYPPALRDGDIVFRLEAQPGHDQIAGVSTTPRRRRSAGSQTLLSRASGTSGAIWLQSSASWPVTCGQTRRSPGSRPALQTCSADVPPTATWSSSRPVCKHEASARGWWMW